MRKIYIVVVAFLASLAASPPAEKSPVSPPVLRITEDDRDILLGFEAARRLALAPIEARQSAYLARLAARLGIPAEELAQRYQINLETLTATRIPEPKPTNSKP